VTHLRGPLALLLVATLALAACDGPEPGDRGEATQRPTTAEPTEPTEPTEPAGPTGQPEPDRPAVRTGPGVTPEPCPLPVNAANGCIYLAAFEDLGRGAFARLGVAANGARRAFWQRVNERGGIAGHDVDATTYVRDTGADPDVTVQAFGEVRAEVLAIASARGTAATAALLPLLKEAGMVALTTAPVSDWASTEYVHATGSSACVDAANAVDHAAGTRDGGVVAVLHDTGAFGEDAAAGAAIAAVRRGAELRAVEVGPGGAADVTRALAGLAASGADVVVVATGPATLERVLLEADGGGTVVALAPSWDERLAARLPPAAARRLRVVAPWAPWGSRTPGHAALAAGLPDDAEPSEAHVAGWVSQYPLLAALEQAAADGELTLDGVRRNLLGLEGFASAGMLPPERDGVPPAARSVVSAVDASAPTGLVAVTGHVAGPTARALELSAPCRPNG
jgi:ABC-type branched-subunit amino acid transport system substrate-binding protein